MSLLRNDDPHYWLAKVVTAPERTSYSLKAFKEIVSLGADVGVQMASLLSWANTPQNIFFHKDEIEALMYPMTQRISAFNNRYATMLQSATDPVQAPDLKADAIELLTFAAATVDGLRNLEAQKSWWEAWVFAVARFAAKFYEMTAGALKAFVASLSTAAKVALYGVAVGGAGVAVYSGYKWSENRHHRLR